MDTKLKLTPEQAEMLAKEILDREPRVRDSWISKWALAWQEYRRTAEPVTHEFNPLVHPSSPRWSAYNSIFDSYRK